MKGLGMTINVDPEVDRILMLLRLKIKDRGFTQVEIQEALNWKGSYVSQLLSRNKSLRVEQVLQILAVIGVEPFDFFCTVFRQPGQEIPTKQVVPPKINQVLVGQMKRGLQATCALIEAWREEGGDDVDQRGS